MSEDDVTLTDEAAMSVMEGILSEMIDVGERHAEGLTKLPDEFKRSAMQINTLLSVQTVLLYNFVKRADVGVARELVEIWCSEQMQNLVSLAFRDEVEAAYVAVQDGIDSLEKLVNTKETDDPSSGPSD
jgi:hypothetical protein